MYHYLGCHYCKALQIWSKFVIWPQTQNFRLETIIRFLWLFWVIAQENGKNLCFLIK